MIAFDAPVGAYFLIPPLIATFVKVPLGCWMQGATTCSAGRLDLPFPKTLAKRECECACHEVCSVASGTVFKFSKLSQARSFSEFTPSLVVGQSIRSIIATPSLSRLWRQSNPASPSRSMSSTTTKLRTRINTTKMSPKEAPRKIRWRCVAWEEHRSLECVRQSRHVFDTHTNVTAA